jgi:hypothetical protein
MYGDRELIKRYLMLDLEKRWIFSERSLEKRERMMKRMVSVATGEDRREFSASMVSIVGA